MSNRKLDALLEYSQSNERICPNAGKWHQLWQLLGAPSHVAPPLILSGWAFSTDREKRARFFIHLRYAADSGQIDTVQKFLHCLIDSEWHTSSEAHLDWSYSDAIRQEQEAKDRSIVTAKSLYRELRKLTKSPAFEKNFLIDTLYLYYLVFGSESLLNRERYLTASLDTYSQLVEDPECNFFASRETSIEAVLLKEMALSKRIEVVMLKILTCLSATGLDGKQSVDRDDISDFVDALGINEDF